LGFVVKNNLKGKKINPKHYHITVISLVAIVLIISYAAELAGLSLFGTCSYSSINGSFP